MTHVLDHATRERSRVALVTCEMLPDLDEDDQILRAALRDRGALVDAVRWDDGDADWSAYDLVVLRSPWDYTARRDAFVAWAHSVPRLANPADVIEWNTDKHYLKSLAEAGLPVPHTDFIEPGQSWTPPASSGDWVVKPAISASSRDTGRYRLPAQVDLAVAHARRLTDAGRTAMIQPYLAAVDTAGETSVLMTPDADGALSFSHAIRKGPILTGPDTQRPHTEYTEEIRPRVPTDAELAVAARAVAAVPGGAKRLLYARVDMIPGADGEPVLLELELTEPSLFFGHAAEAAPRMADAILARL
jgi:hypothetical protein